VAKQAPGAGGEHCLPALEAAVAESGRSLDQGGGGLVTGVADIRIATLGFATLSVLVSSLFASRPRPERIDATGTRPPR